MKENQTLKVQETFQASSHRIVFWEVRQTVYMHIYTLTYIFVHTVLTYLFRFTNLRMCSVCNKDKWIDWLVESVNQWRCWFLLKMKTYLFQIKIRVKMLLTHSLTHSKKLHKYIHTYIYTCRHIKSQEGSQHWYQSKRKEKAIFNSFWSSAKPPQPYQRQGGHLTSPHLWHWHWLQRRAAVEQCQCCFCWLPISTKSPHPVTHTYTHTYIHIHRHIHRHIHALRTQQTYIYEAHSNKRIPQPQEEHTHTPLINVKPKTFDTTTTATNNIIIPSLSSSISKVLSWMFL